MKRCASVLVDMMKFHSKISRKWDKNIEAALSKFDQNSIDIRSKFEISAPASKLDLNSMKIRSKFDHGASNLFRILDEHLMYCRSSCHWRELVLAVLSACLLDLHVMRAGFHYWACQREADMVCVIVHMRVFLPSCMSLRACVIHKQTSASARWLRQDWRERMVLSMYACSPWLYWGMCSHNLQVETQSLAT